MDTYSEEKERYRSSEHRANIEFVKLIEKYECLWKHDSLYYTNKKVKAKAWKDISEATECSVIQCGLRWRYVRQAYAEHVRKSYMFKKQPTCYYLSPYIDFVKPYVKLPICCDDGDQNKNKPAVAVRISKTKTPQNSQTETTVTEDVSEQQILKPIKQTSETPVCTTKVKVECEIETDCFEPKAKHYKTEIKKSSDSKNMMFLESTLPFVDEMTSKQVRRFRRKVMELINNVLENNCVDKPELK